MASDPGRRQSENFLRRRSCHLHSSANRGENPKGLFVLLRLEFRCDGGFQGIRLGFAHDLRSLNLNEGCDKLTRLARKSGFKVTQAPIEFVDPFHMIASGAILAELKACSNLQRSSAPPRAWSLPPRPTFIAVRRRPLFIIPSGQGRSSLTGQSAAQYADAFVAVDSAS